MDTGEIELQTHTIQARFVSDAGDEAGPPIDLPIGVDLEQLALICNALLKNVSDIPCQQNVSIFNEFPFRKSLRHISSLSTMRK